LAVRYVITARCCQESGQSPDAYHTRLESWPFTVPFSPRIPRSIGMDWLLGLKTLARFLHSLCRKERRLTRGPRRSTTFVYFVERYESFSPACFRVFLMNYLGSRCRRRSRNICALGKQQLPWLVFYELDSDAMGPNLLDRCCGMPIKLADHGKVEECYSTLEEGCRASPHHCSTKMNQVSRAARQYT